MDNTKTQTAQEAHIATLEKLVIQEERLLARIEAYADMIAWPQMTRKERNDFEHLHEARYEGIAWVETELLFRYEELCGFRD